MRQCVIILIGVLAACQGAPEPASEVFTEAQRARIEAEVLQIMDELRESTANADPGLMLALESQEPGICVWGSTLSSCKEVMDGYREAWTAQEGNRLQRQERDGEEIRVTAISPSVAVVGRTTQETRGFYTNGEVRRNRFSSLTVFVLENGEWKIHSAQQASWPVVDEGGD